MAEAVTDEELTREPLKNPRKVIRRPRGSSAEHLAALAADQPKPKRRTPAPEEDEGPAPRKGRSMATVAGPSRRSASTKGEPEPPAFARTRKADGKPKAQPTPKPKRRPSRVRLDAAEQAVKAAQAAHDEATADIRRRQQELQAESRALDERHDAQMEKLSAKVEKERDRYRNALQ
ncbi:hypothetical protein [Sphingomonas guangdongensis]|uniref:hypothetical protein n=1 Tax=Sphingomonas guangdongensis TaxID=1141890 RepID=UPI001FE5E356|nr:hypothetical protein [Sphingomonas guangdongensis]